MEMSQLSPRRPYLPRASMNGCWITSSRRTVVDVTLPGVLVPMEYARDGRVVLNIAPRAVVTELANDEVRFNARFGGVASGFRAAGSCAGYLRP